MSFLSPTFLWALVFLAIPIIIHLFNFRRYKKVYFTNVKHLKDVKEATSSRSNIKHWLTLISRLLALLFLVLAFAQPFIPGENSDDNALPKVSIYIDNSFSMEGKSEAFSLLEEAKSKATNILEAYPKSYEFQVLSNDFKSNDKRLLTLEQALERVKSIQSSGTTKTISQVLKRQEQALSEGEEKGGTMYLLSDFQTSILDEFPPLDSSFNITWLPIKGAPINNLSIDSIWLSSPVLLNGQTQSVLVKIKNNGQEKVSNTQLSLLINNDVKGIKDISLEPQSTLIDTLNFKINGTGWQEGKVLIKDFPITFDDELLFTFQVADKKKVISINEQTGSKYLQALYKSDNSFDFIDESVNKLDISTIENADLVILNQLRNISGGLTSALINYVEKGGNVVLIPNFSANKNSYNTLLRKLNANIFESIIDINKKVNFANTNHVLLRQVFKDKQKNIDLPSVRKLWKSSNYSKTTAEKVLTFSDGSTLLSNYKNGLGNLFVFNTDLNKTNSDLPIDGIFVPIMHRMATISSNRIKLNYIIGAGDYLELPSDFTKGEQVVKIAGKTLEFIPPQRKLGNYTWVGLEQQIEKAGFYKLFAQNQEDTITLGFNYNRLESDLTIPAELPKSYTQFSNTTSMDVETDQLAATIQQNDIGTALWKYCIIFVLVFLGIEVLLLKFLP